MLLTTLVVMVVFAGALTRATFGFGEAVISMPLLALLPIGFHTAASLIGLTGLTVAALSLTRGFRDVDTRALPRLAIGTVLGVPLGVLLLLRVPAAAVTFALGAVLVVYGGFALSGTTRTNPLGDRWAYPAGLLSGALGSAYNINGVPVVVYGTLRNWTPSVFRGTLQAHFLISGALLVAGQALGGLWTPALPGLYLMALPAMAAATVIGQALHRRIPTQRFSRYVYLLIVVLGTILLLKTASTR